MPWTGTITEGGAALLAQWTGGRTLTITRAAAGTGTASGSLSALTALTDQRQEASIVANEAVSTGRRLTIQITPPATSYELNQIGVWGKLDSGSETLLAVYQIENGTEIPDRGTIPDFTYTFYALLNFSNDGGDLTVEMDTSALLTVSYGDARYVPKEDTRPASLVDVVTEQDFQPVQSRVMMVTVPAETVTLSPADLPAYLAGLPRLLTRELKITLTAGTCTEAVRFNRFYGPGTISVTGAANAASLLTGGLAVKECSVEITLKQLAISGKLTGNSTFEVNTAPYVLLQDSTVNGGAEGYGVLAYEGANVALLRVTLSNCAYVVMAGYSSTVSVADCTCSENTTGAYVYNGGIVLIDTKTSPTLGGSTHKHTGGIIAKGDGTLL